MSTKSLFYYNNGVQVSPFPQTTTPDACLQVRISAATALCTIRPPADALAVWDGLLQAIQASDEMDDFSEFKHRSTLRGKLCELMCHLLSHPSRDQEGDMNAFLKENMERLVHFVSSIKVRSWSTHCEVHV